MATVEIDKSGIAYRSMFKKRNIAWEEIETIGLTDNGSKTKKYIYFLLYMKSDPSLRRRGDNRIILQYHEEVIEVLRGFGQNPLITLSS